MNHKKMQLLVSTFVDGEIQEKEKALVLSHLKECPECRTFIEQARRIREEICALGEVKLENSFTARIVHSIEKRDEQTVEWLGIEPLARNTFFLLASFVLIIFFLTSKEHSTTPTLNDQLLERITSDSISTKVLLQQENLSKSDLLYAVMTK
jgi:predicted anti-sigma-YlaC factor YlaD